MEFLNPLALVALAAAAIPLIVHLFNFRRPRKVDFSSLAFVKELQKTTMQRVRIKQWLLLLLRTLAIACLVLAFARPTLTGEVAGVVGGQARSSVVIVIDNSLSMTLRDAEGAYLRQAKDVAAGLADELSSGDDIFVVATSDGAGGAARFTNVGSAIQAIEELEPSAAAASLPAAHRHAVDALAGAAHPNREVYVISDLQRTAFDDTLANEPTSDIRTYLLPIGDRMHANVAVTDVRVESRIIEVGQPVRIEATLVNFGTDPIDGYVASLFLDGQRLAQATTDLPPDVPTTVTFTATPQSRGWLSGEVQIEGDAFEYDNVRYFTLHVPERRRILVVGGEGQRLDFVQLALSPELGRGGVAFDVDTVPENGLAAAGPSSYDAVMLVGPRDLSSGEIAALERYVSAGGGLMITPSAEADAADYNALFAGLGAGRFTGFSGALGTRRPIAGFEEVDLEHPLFEGVFSRQDLREERRVESPDVYYAMNYSPGTGNEQTLIQLTNDFPFLQEIRHEAGVIFLLAVAPDPSWSDLPVRGLFIPLLYRSVYYLSASESIAGDQLTAARDNELRVPRVADAGQLRLIAPNGTEYVPEQRSLFGAVLMSIEGSAVEEPGIYDVQTGETLIRRVALNIDERESDVAPLAAREAGDRLAAAVGSDVELIDLAGTRASDMVATVSARRTGVELWNLFLLLALLFLGAEMIVAKQWRPETATA